MKIIIAGSRPPKGTITKALAWYQSTRIALCAAALRFEREFGTITDVVSGGARGVDKLGEEWCKRALGKEAEVIPADWDNLGKAAGMIRNREMADLPGVEGLVALWDGTSPGTREMISIGHQKGLNVLVWRLDLPHGGFPETN